MSVGKKSIVFAASILGSLAAGVVGSLATTPNIPTWYAALEKPLFNPPNGVFGPVWSVLYILMGVALALVIIKVTNASKKQAYIWYGTQLALNTIWSVVFFGLHAPWVGVVVILALIASIVVTMREFYRIKKVSMWLLVPYLAWVSFATYLTVGVALLN